MRLRKRQLTGRHDVRDIITSGGDDGTGTVARCGKLSAPSRLTNALTLAQDWRLLGMPDLCTSESGKPMLYLALSSLHSSDPR